MPCFGAIFRLVFFYLAPAETTEIAKQGKTVQITAVNRSQIAVKI